MVALCALSAPPCGSRLALPWQPDKNDVTRDIASPFAYGRVRVDYPVLKEFSDAEIYEGMGDLRQIL